MQLYNAFSQQQERFRPPVGRPIGIYVCGITPYDTTHLGHAFTYTVFDVLIRHLEVTHRRPVRYVQNLTDIDDDTLRKAAAVGEDWRALGLRWTQHFREDMAWLNLRPPDAYPGATSAMPEIRAAIATLLERGLAYPGKAGGVYFRLAADPEFALGLDMDADALLAVANERGNDPKDPNKLDPMDFVLWQAAKAGEPAWNSPWGPGRPGWHIECSALALKHLGPQLDIHGGGGDLAFPHHCCERAQCRPLTAAEPWTRFWMHVAMVEMDGQKMSKSLGNLVMLRDLAREHEADAVRLYLLGHHYREVWGWDADALAACEAWARTLQAAMKRPRRSGGLLDPAGFGPRFTAALDSDLDTPAAIAVALELADAIIEAPASTDVIAAQDILRATAGGILGLRLEPHPLQPEDQPDPWPEPQIAAPDMIYG